MTDQSVDIHQRMEKLKQECMFKSLVFNAGNFIFTFDTDGRLVFVNKPFLNFLQLTYSEIQGKTFEELGLPDDFAEKHRINIEKVVRDKKALRDRQLLFIGSDFRYYEYLFAPVIDGEGVVKGVIATPRDITHAYLLEKQLTEEYSEFVRRVDELSRLKDLIRIILFQSLQDIKAPVINLESLINLLEQDINEGNSQEIAVTLEMIRLTINKFKISSKAILTTVEMMNE